MALCDDLNDSKVTVSKNELLATLRANREQHQATYVKAMEGYRAALIDELGRLLLDAREGRPVSHTINLVQPSQHIKDYDRVIRMLEMSQADEIVISESQFNQYVMDDWNWKTTFLASNTRYTGK